jgi:outer membrane immunogenic protein
MNRKLLVPLLVASVSLAMAASTFAADIPVKGPRYAPAAGNNWTGCYAGIQGGYAWGTSRQDNVSTGGTITGDFDVQGGLVGGTLGCNWQTGDWVFGVEGDYSAADIKGSATDIAPFNPTFSSTSKQTWLATARGRVGWNWNQTLFYLTGGAAWSDLEIVASNGIVMGAESKTVSGWTAGGGIEYALSPQWSLKGEYLYADFGKPAFFNPPPGCCVDRAGGVKMVDNIVRLGLNYKFWGNN